MEFLNKIELVGIVGQVRTATTENQPIIKFSLVTNYAYKNREGIPVIETTWHTVQADRNRFPDLEKLGKGTKAHVIGRLIILRYTDQNDNDRTTYEVVANSLEVINDDEPLSYNWN